MADATSKIQPPEGKTSIDDKMFFEPERLSYRAAARLAAKVCKSIGGTVKDRVVIVGGTALLVDLFNLKAILVSLRCFEDDYRTLTVIKQRRQPPVEEATAEVLEVPAIAGLGTAVTAAIPALNGALGILSFFREDVDYRGIRTVVDPLAFELALAGELKSTGKAKEVFVIDLLVPKSRSSGLADKLSAVHQARTAAWQTAAPQIAEMARLDAELDRAARAGKQDLVDTLASQIAGIRRDLDPMTQPLSRLDRRLDDLESALNRVDDKSGLTTMARLLRAEAICTAYPEAYLVHAAVVASGGHHRITRHLLRLLFLGDGLSFLGGAVVRWALVNHTGAIERAGINDVSLTGRFCVSIGTEINT
jgi:hypothetical protein